jgi:hypothetical protein
MATQSELDAFDKMIQNDAARVDAAHDGVYAQQIATLLSLSGQLDTAGTIGIVPTAEYSNLVGVVEAASAANLSQAELAVRIQKLGRVAVDIAKKVPGLLP